MISRNEQNHQDFFVNDRRETEKRLRRNQHIRASTFNRSALKNAFKKYPLCKEPLEVMEILVQRTIFDSSADLKEIHKFLTDMKAISVGSAFGNVLAGGVSYLSNVLVAKINKDPDDPFELLHELVVGRILNRFRDRIPNFAYTYGAVDCPEDVSREGRQRKEMVNMIKGQDVSICNSYGPKIPHVFLEYLRGDTLDQSIKRLSVEELRQVFLCIFLTHEVLSEVKFTHGDFHAGNIMLIELPKKISITYNVRGEKYVVNTKFMAKIIDFGFTRLEFEGKVYTRRGAEKPLQQEIIDRGVRKTVGSHITTDGYAPYVDFFKLISHSISSIGVLDDDQRKFFGALIVACKGQFEKSDDTLLKNYLLRTADALQYNNENFLFWYPEFQPIGKSLMPIIKVLANNETPTISRPMCGMKIVQEIFSDPDGKCNGEVGLAQNKDGSVRYFFDCFEQKDRDIAIPKGSTIYANDIRQVYNNRTFPLGEIGAFGPQALAKDTEIDGFVYSCGLHCTTSYKTKVPLQLVHLERFLKDIIKDVENNPTPESEDTLLDMFSYLGYKFDYDRTREMPPSEKKKRRKEIQSRLVNRNGFKIVIPPLGTKAYENLILLFEYAKSKGYDGFADVENELIFLKGFESLERNFEDINDWQYEDEMYFTNAIGKYMRSLSDETRTRVTWMILRTEKLFRTKAPIVEFEATRKSIILSLLLFAGIKEGLLVAETKRFDAGNALGAIQSKVISLDEFLVEANSKPETNIIISNIILFGILKPLIDAEDARGFVTKLIETMRESRIADKYLGLFVQNILIMWLAYRLGFVAPSLTEKFRELSQKIIAGEDGFVLNDYIEDLPFIINRPGVPVKGNFGEVAAKIERFRLAVADEVKRPLPPPKPSMAVDNPEDMRPQQPRNPSPKASMPVDNPEDMRAPVPPNVIPRFMRK